MPSRVRALALTGVIALASGLSSCTSGPGTPLESKAAASSVIEDPQCASGNRAYFGDTHLHTALSPDAGLAGTKLGLDEAYRFARGETVTSNSGQQAALKRPLDFLVVADHAENLGLAQGMEKSDPELLKSPLGQQLNDLLKAGKGLEAFNLLVQKMGGGRDALISNDAYMRSVWEYNTEVAERYNAPGKFSTLIGYEWTSQPGGGNLHRVVVFRDNKALADQILPFSAFDSEDVEDLWAFMNYYEENTGGRVLAIPHNGNLSSGTMFLPRHQKTGEPIDADYARMRHRFEPLVEVTQAKGTGETHPLLSPEDEFAGFNIVDHTNLGGTKPITPDMYPYEYARAALRQGLQLEQQLGVNPFKFGMVGSTDSHSSLPSTAEDNWWGKAPMLEPSPERWKDVLIKSAKDASLDLTALQLGASGLAGVWASGNTRTALWDAMARKEVFGTSGTRLTVRVYGGYDYTGEELKAADWAQQVCADGVPMGGDLMAASEGQIPSLLVQARKDPDGANLDRIQVVKGWLDADGETHEQVFDVSWSDPDQRMRGADGKVPSVGSSVNEREATYTNTIGAPTLTGYWKDPAFDPSQKAFYYVRVIEIPTPTWLAYDRKNYNLYDEMPATAPYTSQERAYTSPIWYNPS
ncbi:DUF3604 domain-containing protein [Synechococcus sp. NOUM97013]|uniref:DUF3604 domain-containing protein n=1 Tax=Synechococcus sp. NOUM97013 TaxID=1442555 RepID=UPI0016470662|nr:DUF3604 domain-containing protein [Synechococcus sp. NOUM97013]